MRLIKKYSYIRAIIIGIPFGIACLFVGISQFNNTPKKVNDLETINSAVEAFGTKTIFDKDTESNFNVIYVKLDTNQEFYAALGRHKKVLTDKLPSLLLETNKITIWHKRESNYIEQLVIGNKVLIEYSPPYWIAHFFFWIGVVTLVSAVIYVIKHPEDLTG